MQTSKVEIRKRYEREHKERMAGEQNVVSNAELLLSTRRMSRVSSYANLDFEGFNMESYKPLKIDDMNWDEVQAMYPFVCISFIDPEMYVT